MLFQVEEGKIRYALAAIKNVGESAAQKIVEEREKDGAYSSLHDFTSRVDLRLVNRRVMERLTNSGAMASLAENRITVYEIIDAALEYGSSVQGDRLIGQSSLFDEMGEDAVNAGYFRMQQFDEWDEAELSDF